MRDQNGGDVAGGLQYAVEDLGLATHIELGRGFVEHDDAGALAHGGQGPRQGHALPLAAGEIRAAIVAAREDRIEVRGVFGPCIGERRLNRGFWRAARRHVVAQRQFEAHEILKHRPLTRSLP